MKYFFVAEGQAKLSYFRQHQFLSFSETFIICLKGGRSKFWSFPSKLSHKSLSPQVLSASSTRVVLLDFYYHCWHLHKKQCSTLNNNNHTAPADLVSIFLILCRVLGRVNDSNPSKMTYVLTFLFHKTRSMLASGSVSIGTWSVVLGSHRHLANLSYFDYSKKKTSNNFSWHINRLLSAGILNAFVGTLSF